jgi:signal transduction histidine kinase
MFFVTGAGQARLQEAGERLQRTAAREHSIDQLQESLSRTVGAQRSYLLTSDPQYLDRYQKNLAQFEPRLNNLLQAYKTSAEDSAMVGNLQVLIGKRLADLAMVLAIQQKEGTPAAVALVKTSVGTDNGLAIVDVLDQLRTKEAQERVLAGRHWASSLAVSRWITNIGTILSLLLVALATRLVYTVLRRRSQHTAELIDQKQQLEKQVENRTQELVELSTHLQSVSEREKASLARELHDELGGLLVGARMDISWAEQHMLKDDPDMKVRLNRVQQNLAAGVDLKRRIIEELRPTLLDNVGLVAALRWQLKETCGNAGLKCIESYLEDEPRFTSNASIALFRIAQEAFNNILKHSGAKTVDMSLDMDEDTLSMRIADDGKGIPPGRFTAIASHGLASMRHRMRALGGRFDIRSPASGGTIILAQVPIVSAVLQSPEDEPQLS